MKRRAQTTYLAQANRKKAAGFTVLEALIAGLIVAAVMAAIGRLGVAAMVTSRIQSSRTQIEQAINDHIQEVQMQDSYLTSEAIEDTNGLATDLSEACKTPSTFLMTHLQKPNVAGTTTNAPEVTIAWDDTEPYLLTLTYQFESPESAIGVEKRLIDINPNFSSQCYDLQ